MEIGKIIKIDNEEYISKKYCDEIQEDMIKLRKDIDTKNDKIKPHLNFIESELLMDRASVIAMGVTDLKGEWFYSKYSIDYLERIIKMIKIFDKNAESIEIIMAKDQPIMFGRLNKERSRISGLILAPRVDNE